ncbi:DUF4153 domain-containing protein [Aquibacillus sediminis]|uniref:DUF4153 domain-containing protein n=1 Tax=Aquibacillus sediminis TaxID=2574734 RepID=UPI0011081BF8|nr:DUF4173 domain-containing protein [Aquibacillus sediminis]
MVQYVKKNEVWFLIVCLGLALLAEWSFFHGEIGVSYLVFITGFYVVFFLRFRKVTFTHRRIGLLVMVSIWLLSASYLIYDSTFFNLLNILVIPTLIIFHIILVTSAKQLQWYRPKMVQLLLEKIATGFRYNLVFLNRCFKQVFKKMDEQVANTVKRILIGLVIGIPLLIVVTSLLMSADAVFEEFIGAVPRFILQLDFQEQLIRSMIVIFYLFGFFGLFQVLTEPRQSAKQLTEQANDQKNFDGVVTLTILLLLNTIYLLFTVVQFTYFFGDGLEEGYTYAEYARKGFFELIVVTLMNWAILITCLTKVRTQGLRLKRTLNIMYSILVIVSTIMLASAYQRLSLYETAYGFTFDRILAHAFMIFLVVIFAYTFIRIWLEKLSLLHFYFITSLLFYTALNVIPLERIIVTNNMERYHQTGRIDIEYLNRLSYAGVDGLIDLYHDKPDYPRLKQLLEHQQQSLTKQKSNWQSYNISEQRVKERLMDLQFDK